MYSRLPENGRGFRMRGEGAKGRHTFGTYLSAVMTDAQGKWYHLVSTFQKTIREVLTCRTSRFPTTLFTHAFEKRMYMFALSWILRCGLVLAQDDDATRIRNNQRRSRARRKDVLKHFQARVQHYETVGITATQEMQQAARKVASENKRLRMLLGCYGVTDAEINCYLQNFERCQRPHPLNANDLVHTAMGRQPTLPVTAVAELVSLFPGIVAPSFMDANPEIETPQTWYDWTAATNVSQSSSLT
jgi:hypothetical protein